MARIISEMVSRYMTQSTRGMCFSVVFRR